MHLLLSLSSLNVRWMNLPCITVVLGRVLRRGGDWSIWNKQTMREPYSSPQKTFTEGSTLSIHTDWSRIGEIDEFSRVSVSFLSIFFSLFSFVFVYCLHGSARLGSASPSAVPSLPRLESRSRENTLGQENIRRRSLTLQTHPNPNETKGPTTSSGPLRLWTLISDTHISDPNVCFLPK